MSTSLNTELDLLFLMGTFNVALSIPLAPPAASTPTLFKSAFTLDSVFQALLVLT